MEVIYTCPYLTWYKFKQCTLKTCKNNNKVTPSRCLQLDRVSNTGNKVISDAELHLYKFPKEDITTRLVSMRKKKAIGRVKAILILWSYIEHINSAYGPHTHTCSKVKETKYIKRARSRYPLSIKELAFKEWMWVYLLDEGIYNDYLIKQKGGECKEFPLYNLLALTQQKFDKLTTSIQVGIK